MTGQRSIFSLVDHELYVVTARHQQREGGQLATWITRATLAPDRLRVVAVIAPRNHTHGLIQGSGRMAINLLAEGQERLVPLFGVHSGHERDKLAGLELSRTTSGLPVLAGTCGWVECRILKRMDSGDRMIYLAEAVEQALHHDRRPLTKRAAFAALPDQQRRALVQKGLQEGQRDQELIRSFD